MNLTKQFKKILILSDAHVISDKNEQEKIKQILGFNPCSKDNVYEIFNKIDPDIIFDCGDICDQNLYEIIKAKYKDNYHYVKGNQDFWENDINPNNNICIKTSSNEKINLFQFHGNGYWTPVHPNDLSDFNFKWNKFNEDFEEENWNILLVGHSHKLKIEFRDGKLLINPGSVNLASQLKNMPLVGTFVVLNLSENKLSESYIDIYEVNLDDKLHRNIKLVNKVKNIL